MVEERLQVENFPSIALGFSKESKQCDASSPSGPGRLVRPDGRLTLSLKKDKVAETELRYT